MENPAPSGDAAARRLVALLRDPDGYFARAREEAREHARQLVSERAQVQPAH